MRLDDFPSEQWKLVSPGTDSRHRPKINSSKPDSSHVNTTQ